MIGYPLDSKVEYDSEGKPSFDRAITSKPLRKLYDKLFTTGVMPNPSDNFQVVAGDSGMTVKVNPGFAVVKGCLKLEETTRTIEIQAASSSLDRIDTVVLRLNDEVNARICDLYVRQGIPATSPTRPDLVRSGSVYEIGLADIFIPKNTATIVQKRITDTRLDPDRCGYVSSISEFDTETLYLQIQNDLTDFKSNEQAEFLEWFEYIKGKLSEDAAGNLQNQIGILEQLNTAIKTNLVNAINWLKEKLNELELKIGTEDISSIGDGTLTGALSALNSNLINLDNNTMERTYIGEGVDAGANERRPYYDFSQISGDGVFLVLNSNGNFNSKYYTGCIVFKTYGSITIIGDSNEWSTDGMVLTGIMCSWHANLYVYRML